MMSRGFFGGCLSGHASHRHGTHNSPYIFCIFRQINISWEPLTHCVIKAIFEYLSLVHASFFPPLRRSRCAARLRSVSGSCGLALLHLVFALQPGEEPLLRVNPRSCKIKNFTLRKGMGFLTALDYRRAMALLTIFLCGLGNGSQTVLAQQYHLTGKWTTLPYLMPINPIRVGLLHTNTNKIGKVLIVAGSENDPNKHLQGSSKAALWDVSATNPLFTILDLPWDVFCNGGTFLTDGRCIVVGGTVEY